MRLFTVMALPLLAAGCATASSPGSDRDSCRTEPAQRFVGKIADDATIEAARKAAGAKTTRLIPPDTMVTSEYAFGRLSINTDADRRILRINCG